MCVFLITRLLRLIGRLSARVNRFNHINRVAVVTPTGRPKSVRNRCVIEVFFLVFLCCHFAFWIFFVDIGAFVIELSHISSLFSFSVRINLKTYEIRRTYSS